MPVGHSMMQKDDEMKGRELNLRRRQNKKRKLCIIGITALGMVLASCGASSGRMDGNSDIGDGSDMEMFPGEDDLGEEPKEWPEEHDSCEVQELSGYLFNHSFVSPYASAKIMIKDYEGEQLETDWDEPSAFRFAGEADVTWQFYNSLAEMETALNETAGQEADENAFHFLYYTFPMTENDHALDLYHTLKRRFDAEEHPVTAWSADNGKIFYYIQETIKEEDGYELTYLNNRNSKVNLYVKDRTAYGLTLLNPPSEDDGETLEYVFIDVFQHCGILGSGWGLDEENLYWIDHEERLTESEDPKRSFLEVRGIDGNWEDSGDEGIMRYFGLLVEADYELPHTENGRMLSLHFSLAEEEGEEDMELRYYLLNGYCMDEPYDMTVTDMETGEVLQESRVSLSIELPEGAESEDYIKLMGDRMSEYEVQKGDSLWRISERFYGTGYKWPTIVRAGDAPEDPNDLLVGEMVFMPEIFYIRKDPLSRGGLRSEGSFQIEQPDGFAYYFLNGDLTYASWEEENQIHSLPVTNPVGENPFHEPEDWEAF